MAVGWTWAFDTPFKWTKQIASHFGGTKQGMCMAWPNQHQGRRRHPPPVPPRHRHRADDPGGDAASRPRSSVNGIAQKPMEGVSMAYTWDKANANAPSQRKTQYFEMLGNRALYHDGWIACTTPIAAPWDLAERLPDRRGQRLQVGALRPDQGLDAEQRPGQGQPGQAQGIAGAVPRGGAKYQVFPLDNSLVDAAAGPAAEPHGGPDRSSPTPGR